MSIDAEVMLTERDLFEGTRAMPEQRVARWTPVIVVVAMLVAFSHEPEILVMTLLVVPMLLVTRSLALRFIVRRQYRAMPEAGRKIEFQFREDGFMMKTAVDGVQRRAQFVAEVGEKRRLCLVGDLGGPQSFAKVDRKLHNLALVAVLQDPAPQDESEADDPHGAERQENLVGFPTFIAARPFVEAVEGVRRQQDGEQADEASGIDDQLDRVPAQVMRHPRAAVPHCGCFGDRQFHAPKVGAAALTSAETGRRIGSLDPGFPYFYGQIIL
jgi:hypothetical protein